MCYVLKEKDYLIFLMGQDNDYPSIAVVVFLLLTVSLDWWPCPWQRRLGPRQSSKSAEHREYQNESES